MKNSNILSIISLLCLIHGSFAVLDGPCDEECDAIENSICENEEICKCDVKYVASEFHNDTCLELAKYWMAPCEEDIQCYSVFTGPVACMEDRCNCMGGNHYVEGGCYPNRLLWDTCTDSRECVLLDHPERVECEDGICVCLKSFKPDAGNTTCINAGVQNVLTIFSIIPVVLLSLKSSLF